MKLSPPLLLVAIALACTCATACTATNYGPVLAIAPRGAHVRPEVARGYAAYGARLAAYGAWVPDATHGVLWCPGPAAAGPSGAPFQPYLSRGRWEVATAPIGGAPVGSPVWRSEDSDTWGEITSHHGWWVRVADGGPSPWCWVPGVAETAARVLWREGDGFVGWAPEPPLWVACDDVDDEDGLDWAFTLLGTLLDDALDQNQLTGGARDQARASTAPSRAPNGAFPRRTVGPSASSVGAAKQQLSAFTLAHPDAFSAAVAHGGSSASGGKSSSSKGGTSATKHTGDDKARTSEAPSPSAMQYYDALMLDPAAAPAGFASQARSATPDGRGAVAASRESASGSASPAMGVDHARSAAALFAREGGEPGGGSASRGVTTTTTRSSGSGSSSRSGRSSHRSSRSSHR